MPTPNYVAQAPTMLMIDETQQRLNALEQGREADRQRINTLEKQVSSLEERVAELEDAASLVQTKLEPVFRLTTGPAPNAPLAPDNPLAPKAKGKG